MKIFNILEVMVNVANVEYYYVIKTSYDSKKVTIKLSKSKDNAKCNL